MRDLTVLGISALLIVPSAFLVRAVVRGATPKITRPEKITAAVWANLVERTSGGPWIGTLEMSLSIVAFTVSAESLLAGWFAFKLASKWEVWRNVVQVPSKLEGLADLEWYGVRSAIGNYVLVRFWVGTLSNVMAGFTIVALAQAIARML